MTGYLNGFYIMLVGVAFLVISIGTAIGWSSIVRAGCDIMMIACDGIAEGNTPDALERTIPGWLEQYRCVRADYVTERRGRGRSQ